MLAKLSISTTSVHCPKPVERSSQSTLDFIKQYAIELGCDAIHLDSGHQRHDAHRLYLQKKFRIASHHFIVELPKNT
jgi:hypothetical protein